jgi:hypothetical protein
MLIWNWNEFFWAIIWDLGAISWCFLIGGLLKYKTVLKCIAEFTNNRGQE